MLAGNLSTRPFYNERIVSFVLALVAIAAIGFSVWTVSTIARLSETRANLDREIAANASEADRVRADVQAVTAGVDLSRMQALSAGVAEANALIAQRTFSWTRFFELIEGAMPYEVRLVGVAQRLEDEGQLLTINLVTRTDDDLNELVRGMLATGAFYDVLPTEKTRNEDGTLGAVLEAFYLPPPAVPESGAGPTPNGGGGP